MELQHKSVGLASPLRKPQQRKTKTPCGSKSRSILPTQNNGKKFNIFVPVEDINAPASCTNILCQIQRRGKRRQSTERTSKQRRSGKGKCQKVNMGSNVKTEHCFEGEETHEITRKRKTARWLLCTFKDRRRNYMKGRIYVK